MRSSRWHLIWAIILVILLCGLPTCGLPILVDTFFPWNAQKVDFDPNVAWLAFWCGTQGYDGKSDVYLANLADNSVHLLLAGANLPTWSPDGQWIGFFREDHVYIVHPDGSKLRKLTSDDYYVISGLSWNSNSKELAFIAVRGVGLPWDAYTVNIASKKIQRVTTNAWVEQFVFSPTGESYVLVRENEKIYDDQNRLLVESNHVIPNPVWVPNEDKLWYRDSEDQESQQTHIYELDLQTLEKHIEIADVYRFSSYAWSADGNWLVLSRDYNSGLSIGQYETGHLVDEKETINLDDCTEAEPSWYPLIQPASSSP